MAADELFHPDHIIPAPELESAVMELSDPGIAHVQVEFSAVRIERFIALSAMGKADAGIEVENAHFPHDVFKSRIELPSCAAAPAAAVHIY